MPDPPLSDHKDQVTEEMIKVWEDITGDPEIYVLVAICISYNEIATRRSRKKIDE